MSADENGEGGTLALYSLLCRHARLSILPNQQATDEKLSAYVTHGSMETWQSPALKSFFEKHPILRAFTFLVIDESQLFFQPKVKKHCFLAKRNNFRQKYPYFHFLFSLSYKFLKSENIHFQNPLSSFDFFAHFSLSLSSTFVCTFQVNFLFFLYSFLLSG